MNAQKKPPHEPHLPREQWSKDNRPLPRVRLLPRHQLHPKSSVSSLETYSNLKKKQMVSVDHVPRSVGHAHRRTDYLRTIHL